MSNMSLPTSSSLYMEHFSLVLNELREFGFDSIRFASYRTAAKLRFIQKKSYVNLLDIWNIIEGFRESGLNGLEPYSVISVSKLESLLTSIFDYLNKRLPHGEEVDVERATTYLITWILLAYDNEGSGRVRVFSVKVALITLCNGKLMDKLRYIFSQISDSGGSLVYTRFEEFLTEILALPAMVLESPTFSYSHDLAPLIFDCNSKVYVNSFLDGILAEPGPPCLIWLPLLHLMASSENVHHEVSCSVCRVSTIVGFRYKCTKCSNFNLCQNCFWQGKTSLSHKSEHDVKEYSTSKKGVKSLRNSFRRSFRCVPKTKKMPRFPDRPERPLNLTHIVPPSPVPSHNGFNSFPNPLDAYSTERRIFPQLFPYYTSSNLNPSLPTSSISESLSESDEEHRLIARYTARLASDSKYSPAQFYKPTQHTRTTSQLSMRSNSTTESTLVQREMIGELEERNREILREINRLRYQQQNMGFPPPMVLEELEALRYHKSDLEEKLNGLHDSRRVLMNQMEALMKLLKAQQSLPGTLRSSSKSPLNSNNEQITTTLYGSLNRNSSSSRYFHYSAPTTPQHGPSNENLFEEFNEGGRRGELLEAADSVSSAISHLVSEINSEEGLEESCEGLRTWDSEFEKNRLEQEEKYLEELRSMRLSNSSMEEVERKVEDSEENELENGKESQEIDWEAEMQLSKWTSPIV